jgi:4-amino-4-deoxy-L-arabinose transferase-like glycosyltransferase
MPRRHWPFLAIASLVAVLLFADLGGDHFWADEGDTAVLASSILNTGLPRAWDGLTFSDSDLGERVNDTLVVVSHPWLQYYVTAASFALFGESTFAARLPFALAGWLTLPLLYALVLQLTSSRRAALSAIVLLGFSVQFLLFSRQSRNYALYACLACALLLLFLRLTNGRAAAAFSATAVGLFHTAPAGLALLAGLGLLTLVYVPCRPYRRWFWRSIPVIGALTLPWLLIGRAGYAQNTTPVPALDRLGPRALQFLIEWASVAPVVALLVLLGVVLARHYRQPAASRPRRIFAPGEHMLLMLAAATFASYTAMMTLSQSRSQMWALGLRYALPTLVMTMAIVGMLAVKAGGAGRRTWAAIMLVLCVTKLGRITPWSLLADHPPQARSTAVAMMHAPISWTVAIFRVAPLAFARELVRENDGTLAGVTQYLNTHAAASDIVITNYEWEPLYFHTGLRQGLKILPQYAVRDTARRQGLPEYVFSVQDARWLVWRWPWEGYQQYRWGDVTRALTDRGAVLTRVAAIPETAWENRANLHFRRFPGGQYLFENPTVASLPDAEIFRIEWPPRGARPAGPRVH